MTIRWRDLLDHIHIHWDRHTGGKNWIAIKCPWCSDDPSTHLGINEEIGIYHCLRSSSHYGRSPYFLLKALGVPHSEMDRLIAAYGGSPRHPGAWVSTKEDRPQVETSAIKRRWASFTPAERSEEALDYLYGRHFWDAKRTAGQYNLRVGFGRWAGRLWFPLTTGEGIIGFTGRAMRKLEPKYMTETADNVLYLPRPVLPSDETALLVEGPFDALRLTDAIGERHPILAAALCGLSITSTKALQLRAIARKVTRFAMTLDSTVEAVNTNRLLAASGMVPHTQPPNSSLSAPIRPRRLPLPPGVGDPGEMTNAQIEEWLRGNKWLRGEQATR